MTPEKETAYHPCPECGKIITINSEMCVTCRIAIGKKRKAETERKRRAAVKARAAPIITDMVYKDKDGHKDQRDRGHAKKQVVVEDCPRSPEEKKRHYWVLDQHNQGVCRFCRTGRDFNPRTYGFGVSGPRTPVIQEATNE